MTKNIENTLKYTKIETTGFQELCRKLGQLEEENKQLKANNKIMADELTYFKEHCADLEDQVTALKKQYDDFYEKEYMVRIEECNRLWGELFDIKHMSVWEFANKYCTPEQQGAAGKLLARSLLGKPMTPEEIAIEEAEDCYVPYTAEDF